MPKSCPLLAAGAQTSAHVQLVGHRAPRAEPSGSDLDRGHQVVREARACRSAGWSGCPPGGVEPDVGRIGDVTQQRRRALDQGGGERRRHGHDAAVTDLDACVGVHLHPARASLAHARDGHAGAGADDVADVAPRRVHAPVDVEERPHGEHPQPRTQEAGPHVLQAGEEGALEQRSHDPLPGRLAHRRQLVQGRGGVEALIDGQVPALRGEQPRHVRRRSAPCPPATAAAAARCGAASWGTARPGRRGSRSPPPRSAIGGRRSRRPISSSSARVRG